MVVDMILCRAVVQKFETSKAEQISCEMRTAIQTQDLHQMLSDVRTLEKEVARQQEVIDSLEKLRDYHVKQIAEHVDKVSIYTCGEVY